MRDEPDKLYRVSEIARQNGSWDMDYLNWFGNGTYSVTLHVDEYEIQKRTSKGYWIDDGRARKTPNSWRFVLHSGRKRYACPTKKEAYESFIARKSKQAKILATQLSIAKKAKAVAEYHLKGESLPRDYDFMNPDRYGMQADG